MRMTTGTANCPPDIWRIVAALLMIWSSARRLKLTVMISTIGRMPPSAAPIPAPTNADSVFPFLDFGLVAIKLRIEHRMCAEPVGPALKERRPAAAADRCADAARRCFDGNDIHAVDDFGGDIV